MSGQPANATLTVKLQNGTSRRWRFELASDAPARRDELKAALVQEFIGQDEDPERFTLIVDGTFASPIFILEEKRRSYFGKPEEF